MADRDAIQFHLRPRPPFRLDLTLWALRRRAVNAVDQWDGATYRRAIAVRENPTLVEVSQRDATFSAVADPFASFLVHVRSPVMIEDCLNPNCHNHFAHLGSGEVYAIDRPLQEFTEFFWMCAGCLPRFALALSEAGALTAVERQGKMHLPPPNQAFDVRIVFPNHTRQASAA